MEGTGDNDHNSKVPEKAVSPTSEARKVIDHAAYNARAVGKVLLHPLSKEAQTEAIAKAREDKAVSDQRTAPVSDTVAQQADPL
uniref:Uncharacterized protein n=1 Tax=Physcomitrium patens TaxID=3218 RepID=A0A2K1K9R1_PHYPA|nr:hypothetical protein PHYPA_009699 [Physcomitrium patens]